ncbi:MAG: c-type cytochrome biogenesis protein CcmI [Alphaproteobacteria bacterium]|nr:c-type cytochrome biogenesis protein CcmI [Alphaproteobacteria bacterium]
MLEFLLALMTTATVGALMVPLLRQKLAVGDRLDHDLAIYRDQLTELERERAARRVGDADAEAGRVEIERRILAAADAARAAPSIEVTTGWRKILPPVLALAIPVLALGVYLEIGRPGVPSMPFEARERGPATETERAPTSFELRRQLASQPDDPDLMSQLGEALTRESDGTVIPEAVALLRRALERVPTDARAAYFLGLHEVQAGDARAGVTRWLDLEARSPEGAPWLAFLRAEIERVARQARLNLAELKPDRRAPPPASGMPQPSREAMEAMAGLNPEQREQAIRGMVEGLAARLQDNPQDRAGWLRLANAWRVLGDGAKAGEAFGRADALAPLDAAQLAEWAETHIRRLQPGQPPSPEAVAVLTKLEAAQPDNPVALFYLGAASFAAGDKSAAAARWKRLVQRLPADSALRAQLEERIRDAEAR